MRIPRFYSSQVLEPQRELTLEPGPSAHIARVLRMTLGQPLRLFDGEGKEFSASIVALDKRAVTVSLETELERDVESPLAIELGIGISRGDRMDWVLQKATELGVTRVVPLFTERTEVKLKGERAQKKQQHWQQVIISACEQCGRNRLPALELPTDVNQWLQHCQAERRFVLHHRGTAADSGCPAPTSVALAVGPEGGLSAVEIEAAQALGFEPLTLGPRVLRTETAPLAAIAILQARWGDMSPEQ
ncbi:16S rRNA (uracil(1498)-N(3))-methyltransferase [Parahaliea sp. F7430]|uniref:Ribosomal RNA small subunit methyltransferase E n=1 Tax=Sediminihaliea albiluteola TaxID=2758564 RepID=A0A7W2TX53_9GAMM|nr:16S rRNA (uracil(1498)-N(3))-methyltransferase [Sediminihaliea albiluteola]MBA6413552.1 16S rRNA (uracil(1498)-N(3))-methyltransferase [Sediminihaliea albiluteola]